MTFLSVFTFLHFAKQFLGKLMILLKKEFTAFILILFLFSCSSEHTEINTFSFEDVFDEVYTFQVPDTLGPSIHIHSITPVGDMIYFSEESTGSVYTIDTTENTMKRFSRFGSGPGEIQNPGTILFENDTLYIGNGNQFLNLYDKHGNFLTVKKLSWNINFIK